MTLTAGTLISDAELMVYPYVPDPPLPRPSLLRVLGNLDAEMMRLLLAEVPHAVSSLAADITIVSADNAAGYTLVFGFQYQQFTHKGANDVLTPIELVTLDRLDDTQARHPAAVVVNQDTFMPVDPLGKRWAGSETRGWYVGDGDKILGRRATAPVSPTSLSDTVTSPDTARDFFLHGLRLAMLLQFGNALIGTSVPDSVLALARERVPQERLLVIQQAHKSVAISSRFGERAVGSDNSLRRRVLQ